MKEISDDEVMWDDQACTTLINVRYGLGGEPVQRTVGQGHTHVRRTHGQEMLRCPRPNKVSPLDRRAHYIVLGQLFHLHTIYVITHEKGKKLVMKKRIGVGEVNEHTRP
jgi:uncharacterized C2H2 Zn-finger protein